MTRNHSRSAEVLLAVSDYDAFAEQFDAHAEASACNARYDRPAILRAPDAS